MRFAVLCDSPLLERWQSSALRELLAHGDSSPAAIVFAERRPRETGFSGGLFCANIQPAQRETADSIHDFFLSHGAEVPAVSRDALVALGLDFILYLGFGPCDAGLARSATHGLWRFRFGDATKHANYPPGVWEILSGDAVTATALCRVFPDASDATVLRSGVFATIMHLPNANADQVLAEASRWPAYVARNMRGGLLLDDGDSIELQHVPPPKLPGLGARVRLAWCLLMRKIARLPNLFFEDHWNVGLVDEPIHAFLEPNASRRVHWFPNHDRNLYIADPMGAIVDGHRVVLCETYDYRTQLGSISELRLDERGWIPSVSLAIPLKVHASYPYLFKVDDDLYCVPESSQAREAALYKVTNSPGGYQRVKTLLPSVACLDPTLFRHGDNWWLFCTDATDGEHTKLLVWYATDVLGEFLPHPLNPVKIDVRSSRPAGTPFMHDGRLFRPSQDCSRTYGGAVTINEITQLSQTRFQERSVASVRPISGSGYGSGIHTLSSLGEMTLVDSKRRVLTGSGLREKLDSLRRR